MRWIVALLFCLHNLFLWGQTPEIGLPRYATDLELQTMAKDPLVSPLFGQTDPPQFPVRSMAEWEELQALVITWRSFPIILTEIVRAARKECRVIISCDSPGILLDAQTVLSSSGVDTSSNVEFVLAPNNSIWVRDYGPNCVYANDVDSLYFIDWRYNRTTRRRDDSIATTLAPYFDAALYTTSAAPNDLVNTGGNFMSDGMGTAFASDLILDENAAGNIYGASVKDEAQIDAIMRQYMGIDRFIKMEKLPFDEIHHIDMHMKLLDEQRLLVGQYPQDKADGPQIEANIQYVLQQFQSSFGGAFDVTRIPMPPDNSNRYPDQGGDYRTYSNAVFVNKTILVPYYAERYDTTALRIWQTAMPGYNIVGINCNDIIPLLGAIHCITKEIGVADPLRIVHKPLKDVLQSPNTPIGYPVSATIQHRSGVASAKVWYTLDTAAAWQVVDMSPSLSPDTTDVWEVLIPRLNDAQGKWVYYYIEATANSGKNAVRPMPAPKGWWRFKVQNDITGTETLATANLLPAFPNPASAITCVSIQCSQPTRGHLGLYDPLGRLTLLLHEGNFPAGSSNYFFDAHHLPSGVYWLRMQAGESVVSQTILVK